MAPDEQLEARLGALEGEALALELLDELAQDLRVDHAFELMAELLRPDSRVRPAAQLRYDEPPDVTDRTRLDVLVAPLDLGDGRAMNAALVGKCRAADIRLPVIRTEIGDLGD